MSVIWTLLESGHAAPNAATFGRRLSYGIGRRLANLRPGVKIDRSCLVSPEAKLCARGRRLAVGARSVIATGVLLQGDIELGEDCSLQAYCNVVGYPNGPVRIGRGVRVAAFTMMVGFNHRFTDTERPIHGQGVDQSPITIGDDCWIGAHCVVVAGVTIGDGCIIGAGSIVTRDVPPFSIAVGAPARVVGRRGAEPKRHAKPADEPTKDGTNTG